MCNHLLTNQYSHQSPKIQRFILLLLCNCTILRKILIYIENGNKICYNELVKAQNMVFVAFLELHGTRQNFLFCCFCNLYFPIYLLQWNQPFTPDG